MTKRIFIIILTTLWAGMVYAQQDFRTAVQNFNVAMESIEADKENRLEDAAKQYESEKTKICLECTIKSISFYIDGPDEFPSINKCVSDFIKDYKDNPTNCPSDSSLIKIAETISSVNPDLKVFLDEVVLCKNIDTWVNCKMPADSEQMLREARKKMDSFKFVKGTDRKKLLLDYIDNFFWCQKPDVQAFYYYLSDNYATIKKSLYDMKKIEDIVGRTRIPPYINIVPYYKNTWEDFCNLAREIGENKSEEKIKDLEVLIESVK